MRFDLLGAPLDELGRFLGGSGRARAVWQALLAGEPPVLGKRAGDKLEDAVLVMPRVAERRRARDGTTKLRLVLEDGAEIESVLIPGRGRTTLCLSTQVGCARGCTFCLTATMKLVRQLSAGEIVAQVLLARREVLALELPPLRNVVYMGMGEPLDNLDAVAPSLRVLTEPLQLGFGPRHVTVSTVGPSPRAIHAAAALPGHLAWSVHAVDDGLRRRLVPTTRHTMTALRDAFIEALPRGRHLFIEMTLLAGENDSAEHAAALADFCSPFPNKPRINLLPMNPGRAGHLPSQRATAFQDVLRRAGYFCVVRRERGVDEGAACGQLVVGR